MSRQFAAQNKDFNPRSPCGERPQKTPWIITGPEISIRAPHAGSDAFTTLLPAQRCYFNPRSPCGERPKNSVFPRPLRNFNPRSPCGERPQFAYRLQPQPYFNPRSPCGERPLHFVASLYYRQNIVFSKTVAANSAGKSRKTAVKNVIAWCEPLS